MELRRVLIAYTSALLFASTLPAQFGTETLPDQDIGRPPQAPFITFLGIVNPGTFVTDASLRPFGPVSRTLYEELRVQEAPGGPAGGAIKTVDSTWDEAGRLIEQITKDASSESHTTNRYEGARLVRQETTFPHSKHPLLKRWSTWVYDKSGKLVEYQRGSGDQIENHDTNFKRDAKGRLTSYEYHQGPNDQLQGRTELRYSTDGKTIDFTEYDAAGTVLRSKTETVDDDGHIALVVIRERDWRTKQMMTPVKVTFSYDRKGRLIEQNTDPHEFENAGSEHELPPGKVSITYDDVRGTKTTSYSADDGSLTETLTLNANGATVGLAVGAPGRSRSTAIECTDDSRGNWTACRQVEKTAGIDTVDKMWRRKIEYR